jgi:hypothetical protein
VFVAALGSDSNPCTFSQPCRTFQHAHDVALPGAEIDVLDPAGYGSVTITKAISIQGHGFSGISVSSGGIGITINAGATDKINLRGLLLEGAGTGGNAILFNTGESLALQDSLVRNFSGDGLVFRPNQTAPAKLSVLGTHIVHNASIGLSIANLSSGAVTAVIHGTAVDDNGAGVLVEGNGGTGPLSVAATDTIVSNNTSGAAYGFSVEAINGHSVSTLVLTRATVIGNATGLLATGANASLQVTRSTVTENTVGYSGSIVSYGDNVISSNGSNTGTLMPGTKQ